MGRIVTVVGSRPEIVKMAPVLKAIESLTHHEATVVLSGEHEDLAVARAVSREIGLREPDHVLELRDQLPHLEVARTIMQAGSAVAGGDLVLVCGGTNTALAGALLASKLGKAIGQVEAGLRCSDRSQPDEVNRVLVDHMSRLLFAPSGVARQNLEGENVRQGVHVVGNPGIDAIVQNLPAAEKASRVLRRLHLEKGRYALLTLHRPENVDREDRLRRVLDAMGAFGTRSSLEVVFPIHPKTEGAVKRFRLQALLKKGSGLRAIPPTGYLDFLELTRSAALVFTDSGSLQEGACFLRVPCVTLRETTDRPETLQAGANVLAGTDPRRIFEAAERQLAVPREWANPYGDGTAGVQTARQIDAFLG